MKIDYYKKYLKYKNKYLELKGGAFGSCGIGAPDPILKEVKIYTDRKPGPRNPWDKSSAIDKSGNVYDIDYSKDMAKYLGYSKECIEEGKNNFTDEKDPRHIMIKYNSDSYVPAGCGITIGNYNCQAGDTEKELSKIKCKKIEHCKVPECNGNVFVV